ncbi:hypothetical protein QQ045_013560 [Rhodiola kirilowii]
MYELWKMRNKRLFVGKEVDVQKSCWEIICGLRVKLGAVDLTKVAIRQYPTSARSSSLYQNKDRRFYDGRRIKAGGPVSPFLFTIVAEGLSRLISKAREAKEFQGVKWTDNGDAVTHLQFADDTIIFYQAKKKEVKTLKWILKAFEAVSGLQINYKKSKCVGIGLKQGQVEKFTSLLGCEIAGLPMDYLVIQVGVNPGRVKT